MNDDDVTGHCTVFSSMGRRCFCCGVLSSKKTFCLRVEFWYHLLTPDNKIGNRNYGKSIDNLPHILRTDERYWQFVCGLSPCYVNILRCATNRSLVRSQLVSVDFSLT